MLESLKLQFNTVLHNIIWSRKAYFLYGLQSQQQQHQIASTSTSNQSQNNCFGKLQVSGEGR